MFIDFYYSSQRGKAGSTSLYHFVQLPPLDETHLIVMDKLFDVLLDFVCQYYIEDFCINMHCGYWPEIFFFSCISARIWYQDDAGLIK